MDLKRGANWRKWDLQVQTILDDGYISLSSYYEKLKTDFASQWHKYIGLVGGEENALLFDSKKFFYDQSIPEKTRCLNYVRNLFAFVNTFNSEVGVIGITDHNYHNNILIDDFIEFSKGNDLKALAGIEINVSGVHMLVFFENAPYSKSSFSEGLKTFLSKINVERSRIMYIEDKSSGLEGDAKIGRVFFSKTGNTLYYKGRKFQSLKGKGFKANYFDVDNGDEFWISGPRKDRNDRLYGGQLDVEIDEDVKVEYFNLIKST
ncbi:hypothetical protein FGF1_40510 [Flavobacteriaceae bacterium GF1]